MRTWNEILSAAAGTIVLNDTSTYTGNIAAIYVVRDCIFTTLDDAKGNDSADYITDPATPVSAGAMLTPFDKQNPFVTIELSEGSVVLVL
jgi:hypothetical protein